MRKWNRFSFSVAALGTAAVLAAAVGGQGPASGTTTPAPRPHTHGHFATAPDGRVEITHGVNMVYKRAPYSADAAGFGPEDAQFLRDNGFTSVRLGVIWKAVEPHPGVYDDAYLAEIRREVAMLDSYGIASLLDFHQDMWNEKFQGEGAPDWAVLDGGLPNLPLQGFPVNYFVNLAVNKAFDSFYANAPGPGGVGLQTRYAAAWAHVASYVKQTPGVMGFDLYNEPWPGTLYATCIPLGCPLLDHQLQVAEQRMITAIRRVDPATPVYYEPNTLFADGIPSSVHPTGSNLGFSFHDYCVTAEVGSSAGPVGQLVCDATNGLTWSYAAANTKVTGATPLLTEFGATTDQPTLTGVADLADQHLTGWMYWAYCGCDDPTTTGPGTEQALVFDPTKAPTGDNVDWAKMSALVTPYPELTAGTPTAYRFDRTTRTFTASWSTARYGGLGSFPAGARTVISTPAYVYPRGYDVAVTGGHVVSTAGAGRLVIAQDAGATKVGVTVTSR